MLRISTAPLQAATATCIVRPVSEDGSAVSPAVRALDVAAGSSWVERCAASGPLPVGSAMITDAGELDAEFVIHASIRSATEPVGPRTVERALRNALRRAEEWGVSDVALPILGTGPGNLDPETACRLLAGPVAEWLAAEAGRRVTVCAASEFEREVAARQWPAGR
ncbi:MAG: macro domain-containing protein [Gemmatimonadota bacterium]